MTKQTKGGDQFLAAEITAQVESFTAVMDEWKVLIPAHWEELAMNRDKVPLAPQFDEYLRRDAAGMILFVTLRKAGELVGYFLGFVAPGLHYETCLTLTMDIFYTCQHIRGGIAGLRMFRLVEKEARRRGVQRMIFGSKKSHPADRLFMAIGCEPVEIIQAKWIGE